MRKIKAAVKIIALIVFTLSSYGVYLIGYFFIRIAGRPTEWWRNLYTQNWARGSAFIMSVKIKTEGTPPEPPFFLVANHLSYLDILPLFVNLKGTFVAKKEVESWPVLGFLVKWVGVIFIDRTKKRDVTRVNEILSNSLNKEQGIIIFPEGTSTGGYKLFPFRSSLLQYPADVNMPVHYATIHYSTGEGDLTPDESVCYYGGRHSFGEHVFKLAQNREVNCTIRFGDKPEQDSDRKVLSDKLHESILEDFTPTTPPEQIKKRVKVAT